LGAIRRLLLLSAVLILLSGSLAATEEVVAPSSLEESKTMEDLLAEQDENLASYKAQLQKAGEEIFAEKKGELRRARAQKLQNAIRALQEKMALELKERQEDLNREVLRQQLQLLLVSLDPEEQRSRLGQIAELQEQMEAVQALVEEEYQQKFEWIHAEHEGQGVEEILALQREVERAMQQELAHYSQGLFGALEHEVAKINAALGRS
jgi:hypothetical protein